jgi:C4-dicarboxylate-specific signal transduction histidine kinase
VPSLRQDPRPVLIAVDDEPVILQIFQAVLEEEPYRLLTAATGKAALALIEEHGCDLLLTDKNLPDTNGLELARVVRARDPQAEVIVVTGYGSLDTAIRALELEVFDYVLKPIGDIFDIRRKVKRAAEKQAMARENLRLVEDLRRQNEALSAALEEARELRAELIQSEKLAGIGTLAAGVAHEISSPLFGVLGLAEAIVDEQDVATIHGHASEIISYSKAIRAIVQDLSGYSRSTEADGSEPVDLRRALADALRLVERAGPGRKVPVQIELAEGLVVMGRPTELQQVFVNLLKNAIEAVVERHGTEGGRVRVEGGRREDAVWVRVIDNGIGIAADRLSYVFDPFYTTKPAGKGTGLGLNVVYRIVTRHKGQIAVESRVGEGTTLALKLPAPG